MAYKKTRKVYKRRAAPRRARVMRMPSEANMKHFDVGSAGISIAGNATSQFEMTPFALAEGTDNNQRLGRKIRIYKVEVLCQVTPSQLNIQPNGDSIRCVIVLDSEVRGVSFTGGDVFDSATATSFYNPSKVPSRFRVLADMNHALIPTSVLTGVTQSVAFVPVWREHLKVRCNVTYTGNAGTLADVQDYGIRAVAISANGTAAVVGTMTMVCRYWFKDVQ